jgi:hypothetical protein
MDGGQHKHGTTGGGVMTAPASVDADPMRWWSRDAAYRERVKAQAQADARAMGLDCWTVCIGARAVARGKL